MGDAGYSMLVGNVGPFALIYTVLGLIGVHIGHLPEMCQSHDKHCTGQSLLKISDKNVKNVMSENISDKKMSKKCNVRKKCKKSEKVSVIKVN